MSRVIFLSTIVAEVVGFPVVEDLSFLGQLCGRGTVLRILLSCPRLVPRRDRRFLISSLALFQNLLLHFG